MSKHDARPCYCGPAAMLGQGPSPWESASEIAAIALSVPTVRFAKRARP